MTLGSRREFQFALFNVSHSFWIGWRECVRRVTAYMCECVCAWKWMWPSQRTCWSLSTIGTSIIYSFWIRFVLFSLLSSPMIWLCGLNFFCRSSFGWPVVFFFSPSFSFCFRSGPFKWFLSQVLAMSQRQPRQMAQQQLLKWHDDADEARVFLMLAYHYFIFLHCLIVCDSYHNVLLTSTLPSSSFAPLSTLFLIVARKFQRTAHCQEHAFALLIIIETQIANFQAAKSLAWRFLELVWVADEIWITVWNVTMNKTRTKQIENSWNVERARDEKK